jgi:hypothetical protein
MVGHALYGIQLGIENITKQINLAIAIEEADGDS